MTDQRLIGLRKRKPGILGEGVILQRGDSASQRWLQMNIAGWRVKPHSVLDLNLPLVLCESEHLHGNLTCRRINPTIT